MSLFSAATYLVFDNCANWNNFHGGCSALKLGDILGIILGPRKNLEKCM